MLELGQQSFASCPSEVYVKSLLLSDFQVMQVSRLVSELKFRVSVGLKVLGQRGQLARRSWYA